MYCIIQMCISFLCVLQYCKVTFLSKRFPESEKLSAIHNSIQLNKADILVYAIELAVSVKKRKEKSNKINILYKKHLQG